MEEKIRKTKIVCTIGPASEDILEPLMIAGMDVARVNFSHGGQEEQERKVEKIKRARENLGKPVALMLDTQGPEVRVQKFEENIKSGVMLNEGDEIVFVNTGILADGYRFSVTYDELHKDVEIGKTILVDDGAIRLLVTKIENEEIFCKVTEGGMIKERKGINVPETNLNIPTLKEKDKKDLIYGINAGFDYIAASFVRGKDDVREIRRFLNENGGNDIQIISKIENQQGIDNLEEILEESDGIMVARGDLSVEIEFEMVPVYQKRMVKLANSAKKPVIIATQMLESMIEHSLPTRAEASDVANAVFDRASAVMLSGESAMGKHPVTCVSTMNKISKNVESTLNYQGRIKLDEQEYRTLDEKAAYMAVMSARKIGVNSIVTYTNTGNTAKKIAGMGVGVPIFAVTDNIKTYNQLALAWNVTPIYETNHGNIDKMIENSIHKLGEEGKFNRGDLIYVLGGNNFTENVKDSKRLGGLIIY